MKTRIWLCGMFVLGLCLMPGCQRQPAPEEGDIDYLTLDENENGFPDVPVPEGVDVEETGTLNVRLLNTISQDDLVAMLGDLVELNIDLMDMVDVILNMRITFTYDDGITDVLEDSETIVPFDKKFEVACPNSVNVAIEVVAEIPFVGPQTIEQLDHDLIQGVDFECGETFEVEAFINEQGFPEIGLDVS